MPVEIYAPHVGISDMKQLWGKFGNNIDFVFYDSCGEKYPYDVRDPGYFKTFKEEICKQAISVGKLSDNHKEPRDDKIVPRNYNWLQAEKNWKKFIEKFKNRKLIFKHKDSRVYIYNKY